MGNTRVVGTAGTRIATRGRVPENIGVPVGMGPKTRVIPMPPVKRIYTHCESLNKDGQPCKAPNVKDQPYCIGHLNSLAAKARREPSGA